ncbi:hypothetical protein ACLMJK_004466 [Lecanora helva]
MLECETCIRRCIRIIFADISSPGRLHPFPRVTPPAHIPFRFQRGYASQAAAFQNVPIPSPTIDAGVKVPHVSRSGRAIKQDEPFTKSSLEQEVRWLKDPLKLGDHVVKLLRQDDPSKALAIVRRLSKEVACTVSWNYLIDYLMSKGRVADAVKLYNEMKKRAQTPDAHTFTTLFRGFSWYPKFSLSVHRTLSIYHSMFADNSPVKPSVIHTNAVLKVCALAGDMDALLGVAARLSPRGPGAPNNLTFTTILNAIRNEAWDATKDAKDDTPSKREKRRRAVMQGRRLWQEIKDRWEKGDLYLDEELVCAMGRLMLIANDEQNVDDILSLLEQTMGIRRQLPRQGEPGRKGASRNLQAIDVSKDSDLPSHNERAPIAQEDSSETEVLSEPESDIFALTTIGAQRNQSTVPPGRNTLSLVIDACTRIGLVRAAQNYWGLLTDPSGPYKILPDTENYHMYLRLLRVRHASKLAVELITDMHRGSLGPKIALQVKTFRIGLSCCVRDKNNKNSIPYAAKLVRLMTDTLEHPDARALGMYLNLGLSQQPRDWRTLMSMVRGTELGIRNLRSLISYGPETGKEQQEDVKELVTKCIGALDVVLDLGNEGLSANERSYCKELKGTWSAWLSRMSRASIGQRNPGRDHARRQKRQFNAGDEEVGAAHEDRDVGRARAALLNRGQKGTYHLKRQREANGTKPVSSVD